MRLTPSLVLLRTQSDERLTALAREGSEPAFTALVERYRRNVLRACMRVLPEARAEDATQQVFVAAWNALNRGDEVRDVRPWLLRIARNTALNGLRTPGYEYVELAESLKGGEAPAAELERRDVVRQTLAGLAGLPENQREALLRSAVQGASHADIARDLGISEGATRQLVLRARASLRSAASAVTPLPLLTWAASGPGGGIAEVAAGGGAAGMTALIAKAGAVVVLAGGAVATPALVAKGDGAKPVRAHERAHAAAAKTGTAERRTVAIAETAATATATAKRRPTVARTQARTRPAVRRRPAVHHTATPVPTSKPSSGSSGSSGSSNSSGSSGSSNSSGSSGHGGSDDDGNSGSGSSGSSGSGGSSGHGGGHGSDDAAPVATAAPSVTVVPTVNPNSGSGSGGDSSGHGKGGDDGGGDDNSGHGGGDDD